MSFLRRVVVELIEELHRRELVVLVPGATVDELASELLERIRGAPAWQQAPAYIARALVASRQVDELYAEDSEIGEILRNVRP